MLLLSRQPKKPVAACTARVCVVSQLFITTTCFLISTASTKMISRIARRAIPSIRVARLPLSRAVAIRCNSSVSDAVKKYQEKLEKRAKAEGLNSIEDLKEKYKDEISQRMKEFNKVDPLKILEKEAEQKSAEERKSLGPLPPPLPKSDTKTLDSFVDVSKFQLHDAKEIELLWKARFSDKEKVLCGALNGVTFGRLYRNARLFPTFVLPLPHGEDGIEFFFVQWSIAGPHTMHCIMTPLAEYKLHQDFAHPHLTLIFHSDLVEKDIVLMNGTIEKDSSLTMDEAVLLSLNLQRFYGVDENLKSGVRKLQLLHYFNSGSESFSAEKLIEEAETVE